MKTTLRAFASFFLLLSSSAYTSSDQALGLIAHSNGIEGEYIVALADGATDQDVDSVIAGLTREFGGKLIRQYRNAFRGFSVHRGRSQLWRGQASPFALGARYRLPNQQYRC